MAAAGRASASQQELINENYQLQCVAQIMETQVWMLRLPPWKLVLRMINFHGLSEAGPMCACSKCQANGLAVSGAWAEHLTCRLQPYVLDGLRSMGISTKALPAPQIQSNVEAGALRPCRRDVYKGMASVVMRGEGDGDVCLFDKNGMCSGWGEQVTRADDERMAEITKLLWRLELRTPRTCKRVMES